MLALLAATPVVLPLMVESRTMIAVAPPPPEPPNRPVPLLAITLSTIETLVAAGPAIVTIPALLLWFTPRRLITTLAPAAPCGATTSPLALSAIAVRTMASALDAAG